MADFQIESGACTGRGFAAVDPAGICAKFFTWVTKAPAAGGPGWTILRDQSATPVAQTITGVDTGTEILTAVAHGFKTGDVVFYSTTGTAIAGLTNNTYYYVRRIDDDTFYLYDVLFNAYNTNAVTGLKNLTSAGTGVHKVTLDGPFIIVSENAAIAANNDVAKIMKIGYRTLEAGYIRIQYFMSWDPTDLNIRGIYCGYRVHSVDAGDFAYDFRGGDQCMTVFSRIAATWQYAILDEWTGITGFVEDTTVISEVQNDEAAGANVVIEVAAGEATLFTVGEWYYIYDFQNKCVVDYAEVTARDLVGDSVTVALLNLSIEAGAFIGAYPHRYCAIGSSSPNLPDFNSNSSYFSIIPYFSGVVNKIFQKNNNNDLGRLNGGVTLEILAGIDKPAPDDKGYYACMRPVITEYYNPDNTSANMNRQYGKLKNIFHTYGAMAQMLDYRTINAADYLKYNSVTTPNQLILHTETP